MIRRLFILAFLLSVAASSLAAVPPHMSGEGCEAKCCQAARQNSPEANLSKLRCIMDCNQQGGSQSPTPASSMINERQKKPADTALVYNLETFTSSHAPQRFYLTAQARRVSTAVYLRTGALLI